MAAAKERVQTYSFTGALKQHHQHGQKWPATKEKPREMRSKLGLAIAFVLALTFGMSGALANDTGKTQNTNSSTTTTTTSTMKTTKHRRSKRRKQHRKYSMKRKSRQSGNSNTRS
jgi:hypothetical protein